MSQKVIHWNFVFVTWFVVFFLIYRCYLNFIVLDLSYFDRLYQTRSLVVYTSPIALLGLQLFFWRRFYHKNADGAKGIAFIAGGFAFLVIVVVPLLVSDITDIPFSRTQAQVGSYVSFSHFVWAALYKGR